MSATPTAPLLMNWVSTVASRPMHTAKKRGDPLPNSGSSTVMRKGVTPLLASAIAPDRGCTVARMKMIPQATPESTMALKGSRGLPLILMKHITPTTNMQIPVFPMLLRKRTTPARNM